MKKILFIILTALSFSCNYEKKNKGEFTVSGHIKNVADQNIYLEEVYFNDKPPLILDTSKIIKGDFSLVTIAAEESIYRLRLEKDGFYIFINDKEEIPASIDAKGNSIFSADFNTPANKSLIKFLYNLDSLQSKLKMADEVRQSASGNSTAPIADRSFEGIKEQYTSFILNYIDTTKSPVVALFALGYTQGTDAVLIDKAVNEVTKKFPDHKALNEIASQYKKREMQQAAAKPAPAQSPSKMAPEINLPDTNGNLLSLSSLRGKYVLVDFWASWCGPCRMENPNVVSAYNLYKNKDFTILGVSLDREKADWIKAIREDGLTWNHVSDLKFWNSAVVPMYNIEGIPFNVLVDPLGKIIADNLRGDDLKNKLAEVLK